jgi:hypothetical protein
MNRQIAYADSIRVAANAVVSDVNVVITSGDITARQRPQSDVVAARGNIDARTSAQCYVELAGDIDTRYRAERSVSQASDVLIQGAITGPHVANACRVGKKSVGSISHIVCALCIMEKGLHTHGVVDATCGVLVERSVPKRRVPHPGGEILQRASSIDRVTPGERGFRRLTQGAGLRRRSQGVFEERSTGRVGGRSSWRSQEKGQRY